MTPAQDTVAYPARWWHRQQDGHLVCELCPRTCRLGEGQRGACFVRAAQGGRMVLTTWGRSSGFCIDPVEKKPLYHFLPGAGILSFGTAGCNLTCKFCQNWDISRATRTDRLVAAAHPAAIAEAALAHGAAAVAFTYNDPVIFAEYALDTAAACRERGIHPVAVTAGYISPAPARDFFPAMAAANVDLKSFREDFYRRLCGGHLQPVLDTLAYIRHETSCWLEITTLLIPGENDSSGEITELAQWIFRELGPEVPLHFTAFHPDWKLRTLPVTPLETLQRARRIARDAGLHHVYLGNISEPAGGATRCTRCKHLLIQRDGYRILDFQLTPDGACPRCGDPLAGVFLPPQRGAFGLPGKPLGPRAIPLPAPGAAPPPNDPARTCP